MVNAVFRMKPRLLAGVLACSALPGCAWLAPGMQMSVPNNSVMNESTERGTPLSVELLPITPDLLKNQEAAREALSLPSELTQPAPEARLGPGDVLNISVYEHPEFNTVASGVSGATAGVIGNVIDQQGLLRFPLAGTVKAAGLTTNELTDELNRRLARYIQTPQASVRVIDYRNKKVLVEGEVRTAGLLPITDIPLTLTDALGRAGGALPTADQSRVVLYRNRITYDLNIPGLMRAGMPVNQVTLRDGDVLRVPSSRESQVFVIGEVSRASAVPMRHDGLRLSEALGEALGVSGTTGNARQIYVIRNAGLDKAQVFHLSAKSPVSLVLADNFRLQPRDVVYVDSTALVRFNRVISLIIPSAQAVRTGQDIGRN